MRKHTLEFKRVDPSNYSIKEADDGSGDFIIEGYASTFGNVDAGNDIMCEGAFTKTLVEMGPRIAFCLQHDLRNPVGKILKCAEDQKGLPLSVRISDAEPGVKTKIKEGILKELSIGFETINSSTENRNGTEVRLLKEVKLYEISLVTLAMNSQATIDVIKSALGVESIEDEFDRLIINTKDNTRKFELLMLKNIALAEIACAHKAVNSQKDTLPNRMEEPLEVATLLVTHFKNLVSKDGRETNKGPN